MLQTRSLIPLRSTSSQQWQLQSVLRLPPELRQLTIRTFSASALQSEDDRLFTEVDHATGSPERSGYLRVDLNSPSEAETRVPGAGEPHVEQPNNPANAPLKRYPHRLCNREISRKWSIRSVASRKWGENAKVDALVRSMKALDPIRDATAREHLMKRIKLEEYSMQRQKKARTSSQERHAPGTSYTSEPFEPFQEQHDPDQGFGETLISTSPEGLPMKKAKATPTPGGTSEQGSTRSGSDYYRLVRQKGALDPEKHSFEISRIERKLNLVDQQIRSEEEDLHKWRNEIETDKYKRFSSELREQPHGADLTRTNWLKARLRYLHFAAVKRRARAERDPSLEATIRSELDSESPLEMVVRPNGSVMTRGEQETRMKIISVLSTLAWSQELPSKDEIKRLKEEQAFLDRKAWLRGLVLRKQSGHSRGEDGSISAKLALLKNTLLESPDDVANAPAIQRQLKDLEETLRSSLKAGLPAEKTSKREATMSALADLAITAQAPNKRSSPKQKPGDSIKEETTIGNGKPIESKPQQHLDEQQKPNAKPHEAIPQDVVVRPEDVSIFAELRAQIQELTGVLKILVSQQATSHSAPAAARALSHIIERANDAFGAAVPGQSRTTSEAATALPGRYQAMAKAAATDAEFMAELADLPHEVGFEDKKVPSTLSNEDTQPSSEAGSTRVPETNGSDQSTSDESKILQATVDSAANLEELGSLYEQLFPEEASRSSKPGETRDPMPRLSLPHEPSRPNRPSSKSGQLANLYDNERERGKTVLVLSGASKTLTEDDFRRAMPRGKHLQEWTQKGEYERVIPVRDFWTLERTGDYYIVFKHSKPADAFLSHVKRVFGMTREHTPSSLMSELPPAPQGLLRDGVEDEADLVRNFTLVAPSMSLSLQRMDKGVKAEVLKKGGYPQALAGNLVPETPQVLLEMEGGVMPNWFQIRDAISKDGLRRSLPWNLIPGDLAIRKLTMTQSSTSSQRELEAEWEANLGNSANELVANENFGSSGFGSNGADALLAQDRLQNGANGQRWLVAFREMEEAQRFARGWHMRGFPWTEAENKKDRVYRGTTRMKAEVLW